MKQKGHVVFGVENNKKAISDLIQAIQNLEGEMKTYKVIEPFEENLINWLKSKNE